VPGSKLDLFFGGRMIKTFMDSNNNVLTLLSGCLLCAIRIFQHYLQQEALHRFFFGGNVRELSW
jgi:hypothetical protein